jgi:orotidine-5'-phosphate decarboxylase
MNFGDRLAEAVRSIGAPIGLGLDPHLDRLPASLRRGYEGLQGEDFFGAAAEAIVEFNLMALDAAAGRVAAVKPQFAFYEQLGSSGWAALEATCEMARERGLLIVGDAKRGDISSTGAAYARAILDPAGPLGCDSVTLSPWMGSDTLDPFLPYCREGDRGIFALVRTTNPGSALLQRHGSPDAAEILCGELASLGRELAGDSGLSAIGAVVGAMAADEAQALRRLLPQAWFLVPGMGAQGASARQALAGRRSDGLGSLVVSSRSLLFPKQHDKAYERNPEAFIREQITDMAKLLAS